MMAGKRLVPYARISRRQGREKRGEAFIAEKNYREAIEKWADSKPVTLLDWHCDFDQSGGKLSGRPELDHVMELIRTGQADGVVTPEAKRFSRAGLRDALDKIAEIREAGGVFVPLDVPGAENPDDENAELALNIWLAMAHKELRGYRRQWRIGKRRAHERGVPIAPAPFGYQHKWRDNDPALGSLGLVRDPKTARIVQTAFRRAARDGLHAAVAYLKQAAPERQVTRTRIKTDGEEESYTVTEPRWTTTTVRRMLSNEAYLGRLVRDDPEDDLPVIEKAHQPLVDRATFVLAQTTPKGGKAPSAEFPLRGVARCGSCGDAMVGSRMGKGQRAYRCGCGPRRAHDQCPAPATVLADPLEDLMRGLASIVVEAAETTDESEAVEHAQAGLAAAEAELAAYLKVASAADPGFAEGAQLRRERIDKAKAALAAAHALTQPREVIEPGVVLTLEGERLARVFRDVFARVTVKRGHGRRVPLNQRVRFELTPALAAGYPSQEELHRALAAPLVEHAGREGKTARPAE